MKYNILYIDDEQSNLSVFKASYKRYYNIYTAISPKEAFKILKKNPIHLIITDQRMPVMTGIELLREVKKKWPHPKRILLTAYTDYEVLKEAVNVIGVWRYIHKPYEQDSLKMVMDNALEAYQLEIDKNILIDELDFNKEMLEKMLNTAQDAIITIDDNHNIIVANKAAEKMFDYKLDELLGEPINKLIPKEKRKVHTEHIKSFAQSKDISKFPEAGFMKYGLTSKNKKIPIECSISKQKVKNGYHYNTFIRDISERKISENKLKESESKLKEAQELAHNGHWHLDIINNELYWSDEIYRIFGIGPQEFEATYESFLDNIHPDDREMVNKAYTNSLKTKKPYDIVHRLKLKDGTIKFVNEKCQTFFDKNGQPLRSVGTVQDITELKVAEDELLRSEKRFKGLFEDLGDAVFVTKIGEENKGRILEVNSAAIKQTGYTRNELLNMNIINDIFISGSGEISTDEWEDKLNKGETVTTTEKKRRKDGTEFWTEVIVTSIDFKGERASLSINRDITKRKQAEEKLKKSEEKYFSMIQNMVEGFYSITLDGKLLDYNPGFMRIIGLDPDKDHTGIGLPNFWQNPEDRKKYIEEFLKNGFIKNYRVDAKKIDGEKIVVQINSLLVKDKKGKPLRIEGTFMDITERRRAEEEIRKLNEELEKRVQERTKELRQFRLFADASNEGFGMADLEGQILYQNKALNKLLDEKESPTGKMILAYFSKDSRRMFEDVILNQIKEIGHWNGEICIQTAKGRMIDTNQNFFLIKDENGRPSRIAVIVTDITKRKLAEAELRKKTEDLEAFNKVMIDREMRIIEMKEEVNKLSEQIGIEPPYVPVWKNGE